MNEPMMDNPRRRFLGQVLAGTAAGITTLSMPFGTKAIAASEDADEGFHRARGKHRIVYDASEPHEGIPKIRSWLYYLPNYNSSTPETRMTAMVLLRHNEIPF